MIILGDVGQQRDRLAATVADAAGHALDGVAVTVAVDHHLGASGREGLGDGAADVAAGAGDERHAAVEAQAVGGEHDLARVSHTGYACAG